MDGMSQDPMQQQQMQALMAMAGSLGMGAAPDQGGVPPVDPNMAQAYMQMFLAMQQNPAMAQAMAMPNMSLPGAGMNPYAAPQTPAEPTVAVSVEGMKFQYQLTEDDLHKVFSRYGAVKQIRVDEAGAAGQITFQTFQDAQSAMNDLNGKVLNGLEGTLKITWIQGAGLGAAPANPYASFNPFMGFPGAGNPALPGAYGGAPPAPANPPGGGGGSGGNSFNRGVSPNSKGVRKYTCRFLIGIENDQDFQVARRIIGAKGANMKRIVMNSEAKLRLRGEGSGYFEGAGQKESAEPLQLCISCTNAEGYKSAVRQVEELLKRVYDEYKQHLRDSGRPVVDLSINLSENQLVYSAGAAVPEDGSPKKFEGKSKRGRGGRDKKATKSGGDEHERGEPGPNAPPEADIEKLIDDRNEARRANNFAEADRIRELLHTQGVTLMDEPGGRGRGAEVTTWRYWRD